MSPDPTDSRFARDQELAQLHGELTRQDEVADRDVSLTDADERAAAIVLPALNASMFSPAARRYVTELLLGGENPTPGTRQKLVEAANRGLRNRQANRAPLPALLAFKRKEAGISVEELAGVLQVSVQEVYGMESGQLNVRKLGVEHIAKWIRSVRADPVAAIEALQQVLALSAASRSPQATGRKRSGRLSDTDQQLIEGVAALLEETGS